MHHHIWMLPDTSPSTSSSCSIWGSGILLFRISMKKNHPHNTVCPCFSQMHASQCTTPKNDCEIFLFMVVVQYHCHIALATRRWKICGPLQQAGAPTKVHYDAARSSSAGSLHRPGISAHITKKSQHISCLKCDHPHGVLQAFVSLWLFKLSPTDPLPFTTQQYPEVSVMLVKHVVFLIIISQSRYNTTAGVGAHKEHDVTTTPYI